MNLEPTTVPDDVLDDLLAEAHRAHDVIASALDRPFTIMFADDVADRRTDLSSIATGLLDEVEQHVRLVSEQLDHAA